MNLIRELHVKFLLTGLLVLASCSPMRRYLIVDNDLPGWELAGWKVYDKQKDLEQVLGKNAVLYMGYGLERFLRQEYVSTDYKTMHVEMYFTPNEAAARQLYQRFKTLFSIELGNEGSESPGFVAFYRQNCFVKIIGVRGLEGENYLIREIGKRIDLKIQQKL